MKKKAFNLRIIALATFTIGIMTTIPFISIYSADGPVKIASPFLSCLHSILEFPTYILFWKFILESRDLAVYLLAYGVNCIFYGIITERIFTLKFKNK